MTEKPTVLVLDDEREIRKVVAEGLEIEGYNVVEAGTRRELEEIVAEKDISLFLLDITIPDGSGLDIARDLRRQSSVGIILLTGRSDETDQVVGLELGADDYVGKPFRIRELRARVNSVYRRTAGARFSVASQRTPANDPHTAETFRFHGISLTPSARSVKAGDGTPIELTTMEFDVLAYLARNRNRVLSRDQIMDHVRGPDWAVYDRTVDGIISRLRHKLYPGDEGADRIKTIRGVGYMLSVET